MPGTVAVIAIKGGTSFEAVARQLGHADISQVVRCYGRHRPGRDDIRVWESAGTQREPQLRVG